MKVWITKLKISIHDIAFRQLLRNLHWYFAKIYNFGFILIIMMMLWVPWEKEYILVYFLSYGTYYIWKSIQICVIINTWEWLERTDDMEKLLNINKTSKLIIRIGAIISLLIMGVGLYLYPQGLFYEFIGTSLIETSPKVFTILVIGSLLHDSLLKSREE